MQLYVIILSLHSYPEHIPLVGLLIVKLKKEQLLARIPLYVSCKNIFNFLIKIKVNNIRTKSISMFNRLLQP